MRRSSIQNALGLSSCTNQKPIEILRAKAVTNDSQSKSSIRLRCCQNGRSYPLLDGVILISVSQWKIQVPPSLFSYFVFNIQPGRICSLEYIAIAVCPHVGHTGKHLTYFRSRAMMNSVSFHWRIYVTNNGENVSENNSTVSDVNGLEKWCHAGVFCVHTFCLCAKICQIKDGASVSFVI